jgi:diguanylate cyclase (GGDEF)-like protein
MTLCPGFPWFMADDQTTTSKSKLPPVTLSVVMPALPASIRKFEKSWIIWMRVAAIAITVVSIAAACLLRDVITLIVGAIILCGLNLFATWQMKKLLIEHDDYENRLREMTFKLCEKNVNLKQLVQIDPLTQLLNRRGLEKALMIETSRADRQGLRVFAALMDCDDFKQINEAHGHAGGDLLLQNMATNIFRSIRPTDYAARVGGDEFIVFIIDVDEAEALEIAERCRKNIAESPAVHNGKAVSCTVSIGISELPMTLPSIEDVLTFTRQSLESSKKGGKNVVTVSGAHQKA